MKQHWNKETLRNLYYTQGLNLRKIGERYGVTRERIRQVMEYYGIPRITSRVGGMEHKPYKRRYKSAEDYIRFGKGHPQVIRSYLDTTHLMCAECGSERNIHIHHIVYPAKSLEDIQFLCAVCHCLKHRKMISLARQIDLFNDYKKGMSYKKLMAKYDISKATVSIVLTKIKNGWHTYRNN